MKSKKILAGALVLTLIFVIVIGIYVFAIFTDTQIFLLNPPEKPKTLSFILLYPSESVLFPELPINTTEYVNLNIELNYIGDAIAERQPVNLTVSGFMTQPMANKTDRVFVEFRGAVPYDNGSSSYGPWFSGAVLTIDRVDEEGRFLLTNKTVTIVWNVQGAYNPVVAIQDKHTGENFFQEYPDFPVYVIGYSDFQQAKSNKINTALSFAAVALSLLLSIDLFLRLFELREKNDSSQNRDVTNFKSASHKKSLNMEREENKNQKINEKSSKTEEKQLKTKSKKEVSLKQFIEENHKLFTVIGVMGGLAALFTRLQDAEYLSILSFVIMLILDIQLWFGFPRNEEASLSITVFEMFFQIYIFAIGYYLFSAYWGIIKPFFVLIVATALFGLFAGLLIITIRKYKINFIIREVTGQGKLKTGALRGLISGGIIGGLFLLAFFVSQFILSLIGFS